MYVIKQLNFSLKNKHLQSLTHNILAKSIRIKHIIEKADFFEKDEVFNKYTTNHKGKFDLYLVKNDFILIFQKDFNPRIQSELRINQ